LALALGAGNPARPQEPPAPKAELEVVGPATGVDVTFLANAGFLIQGLHFSFLIDAFLREPVGIYGALPTETYKDLVQAKDPFDGFTIVLVSHDHPDHVQYRGLEKFLASNNKAELMAAPRVLNALRSSARDFEAIQRRLCPVETVPGSMKRAKQEEVTIDFFRLEHGGKNSADVQNLGHVIEMGGVRLLHVGDAEPTAENFAPYDLEKRAIDVAFVPYWFFGTPEGSRVLHEKIHARTVVACHVPPSEWEKLSDLMKAQFPDVVLFHEALEKRHFEPASEERKAGG
jgi:L-ascorbate metabolism protein UlaG (beta-lactamase superfamily)